MTRKDRKIACPKCHRRISEDRMAEHLRHHEGKTRKSNRRRVRELYGKPKMLSHEKLSFDHIRSKPQESSLTEEQIKSKFTKSLSDVQTSFRSLRLEHAEAETGTIIDEQRNLVLRFDPILFNTFSEGEIDALLLHEACHVSTLPDSKVTVMDMGEEEVTVFLMNYVDCYQEYLAHLEFMKKFANDIRFIDLKKVFASYLANFDRIIENIRKFIEQGLAEELEKNQFSMSARLYAIIYDALFFYVAKDDSFQKWCKEREMMNLCLFSSWILEDFEYIRRLKLDRKEEMDKISMSGWLSTSVNPLKLLLGQIDFDVDTKETRIFDEEKDADLALLWEKRRSSYQN